MSKRKSLINWQLFLGMLLILIGVVFLIDLLLPNYKIMGFGWPIIVISVGLFFIIGMLIAREKSVGLAIPGTLITSLGVLLLLQNTFNLWLTWTYAWTLLISALGLGLLMMNTILKRPGLRKAGGALIGVGLVLFVILGIFFEIILNISGENKASGVFLGVGLVFLGLFILFSRFLFASSAKAHQKTSDQVIEVSPQHPVNSSNNNSGENAP